MGFMVVGTACVVAVIGLKLVALVPSHVRSPLPNHPFPLPSEVPLLIPHPAVSCVGEGIAGSMNGPTHGIRILCCVVDRLINDVSASGSGVGVPADVDDNKDDGTPTPLPQHAAGPPALGGVSVFAKPVAKCSSETLTPSFSLGSIACGAMPRLRLRLL